MQPGGAGGSHSRGEAAARGRVVVVYFIKFFFLLILMDTISSCPAEASCRRRAGQGRAGCAPDLRSSVPSSVARAGPSGWGCYQGLLSDFFLPFRVYRNVF